MSNKRELSRATKESKKFKSISKPKDKIYDPMGQWAHPGEITRIPGGNITMQGVPYPVYAVPNIGIPQMMYPGINYNFPGADYVDEYPLMHSQEGIAVSPSFYNKDQFQSGGSSDTDYVSVNPLSVFGATPGLYTEGYERPTLDLTLGRRNMFPGLAKRSALEAISGTLTTSLPYQNNTGLGVYGNLKLVGDRWKNAEDVAKANVEVDLGAGYDPNMGPYARLIGSPQFTFGNVQPNIEKTYKGNLRAGEWLGKVGPYGGLSFTPGRPKQEERTSIGFGGRGNFAVGIGGGKTLGASGYFGVDPFGQATGKYNQSGLKGRTNYGFDVNLTIPFGIKQKQAIGEAFQNLFTSKQPVTSYRPMFMQEGGESFELELSDAEIEEYRKGGYIVEELPKAQYGIENYTVDYLGFDPSSPSWQQAPKYVQKGKSFHYKPNINLGKVSGEKFESPYKRTIGDFFYDAFKRGKKDPRIQQSFQTGGDLNPTMCPEGYTFNPQSNMCEPNIREFSPSLPGENTMGFEQWRNQYPEQWETLVKNAGSVEAAEDVFNPYKRVVIPGRISGIQNTRYPWNINYIPRETWVNPKTGVETFTPYAPQLSYKIQVDPKKAGTYDKESGVYYVKSKDSDIYRSRAEYQLLADAYAKNQELFKEQGFEPVPMKDEHAISRLPYLQKFLTNPEAFLENQLKNLNKHYKPNGSAEELFCPECAAHHNYMMRETPAKGTFYEVDQEFTAPTDFWKKMADEQYKDGEYMHLWNEQGVSPYNFTFNNPPVAGQKLYGDDAELIATPEQASVQRTLQTPVQTTTTEWVEAYPGGPKYPRQRPTPTTQSTPWVDERGAPSKVYNINTGSGVVPNLKNGGYIVEKLPKAQEGLNVDPEMIYKDKYNTPLTPEEKVEFDKWVQSENKKQGRDILMDAGAYDVQGFWKSGEWNNRDSDGHGTDRYKKPNHPTFSEESMYSGQDGNYGGYWGEDGAYYPSAKTSDLYGGKSYYDWFFKQEEGRPEHYGGTMLPAVEVKRKKLPKAQQGTTRIDPSKARGRMSLLEKYEGDPTLFIPKPEVSESTQPKVVNRQAQTNAKKAVTETKQTVDAGAQMAAEAPHLTTEQKYEIITDPQKSIDFYNTQVTSQENQGSIERKKEQTNFERAIDYMTNPGDALYYMMRGEDLPGNYLEMRRAGIDPINDYYNAFGPSGGNTVLRGLDAALNPSGVAEAAYDISKGDYASALMNLAMLAPAAKSFKYMAGKYLEPAGDIFKGMSSKAAFQTPAERLMDPDLYRQLAGSKQAPGLRNKIYNKLDNKAYRNLREKEQKDIRNVWADESLSKNQQYDKVDEIQTKFNEDLEKLEKRQFERRLKYSGLPIEPTGMGGGQGRIYQNKLNSDELIKLGSWHGTPQDMENLINAGKDFNVPGVQAAFPNKYLVLGKGLDSTGGVQFMPKLSGQPYMRYWATPESDRKLIEGLKELDARNVGVDFTGQGNIMFNPDTGTVQFVDLAYLGPNSPWRYSSIYNMSTPVEWRALSKYGVNPDDLKSIPIPKSIPDPKPFSQIEDFEFKPFSKGWLAMQQLKPRLHGVKGPAIPDVNRIPWRKIDDMDLRPEGVSIEDYQRFGLDPEAFAFGKLKGERSLLDSNYVNNLKAARQKALDNGNVELAKIYDDLLQKQQKEALAAFNKPYTASDAIKRMNLNQLVPAAGAAGAIGLMGSQTESEEPFSTFRPLYQQGGSIEADLTPEEIQWYLDNGYNVEEVADYQDGGEIISSHGWDYKKEGDQYFTRKTGTSQWITPTGNALTAIKQKVFNEIPYASTDRRAEYLKNLETLVKQGRTIDDLVKMGMGTKAGLTAILGTTETATPQVSETVNSVEQKSYWDPYKYGNKYNMTGIKRPSFNLDMSSIKNFTLSKEPENVAYAKELRKEGKALMPTEQQAFDINYDPYQMAANRFIMPKTKYDQEVFTAHEVAPVSNHWNPMFSTYAEAMGQLFNPEVPEYSNQQSTLDRVREVAKMFADKESIVPQEQSLPINYDPRMSAQKDSEYRAARNFWDNKTKNLEDANALFDRETLYRVQDYKKNWASYAKRYLTKKGYIEPDAVETDYEDTKQKIEEKPRVDTFFEKLENSQDKHYKNTTGAKLMKFRHQWDGNKGFTYYVTKSKGPDRNSSETYENVEGVGHFALDANPLKGSTNIHRNNFTYVRNNILNDEYIPIYKQSLEKNKINMSYKKPSEMTPEELKALEIFKKYDEKFKKATSDRMKDQVAKEYAEEIDDSDVKIVEPLRQLAFDDIDFSSGKKAPTFKSAKYIQTKDGKETKLLYTNPSKKAYGRFDGAGVSFIFKDKYGNTIVRDFAGSIVDIQEEGKNIKKQYNLKDGDLIVGYHDVGSFSAKPAAQDGKLRISDFDTYNDSPGTGTALIIPSNP